MTESLRGKEDLLKYLEFFININGLDEKFNTPDFILAEYLYINLETAIEKLKQETNSEDNHE